MGLCIGYESALRYWLTKPADEALPGPATIGRFKQAEATAAPVKEGTLPFGPEPGRPLHLVVCDPALKHRIRDCQVHVCRTDLPPGSFRSLPQGNIVSSPELTFLQMASTASLWQLIEVGNYLCSTFSISDKGRSYTGKREQLVSTTLLGGFLSAYLPTPMGPTRHGPRSNMSSNSLHLRRSHNSPCTTACLQSSEVADPSASPQTRQYKSTSTASACSTPAAS